VRAILDGHIVLSRQLGAAGHYPAIDVLQSVSRLGPHVAGVEDQHARKVREALAAHRQAEDLIQLGAYVAGSNPRVDSVLRAQTELAGFLRQDASIKSPLEETRARLAALASLL